jgi:hypothetical protein
LTLLAWWSLSLMGVDVRLMTEMGLCTPRVRRFERWVCLVEGRLGNGEGGSGRFW